MGAFLTQLRVDLSCPVCLDVFNDPVVLACGHSFCTTRLYYSRIQDPERECLICKLHLSSIKVYPIPNLALKVTLLDLHVTSGSRSKNNIKLCFLYRSGGFGPKHCKLLPQYLRRSEQCLNL
uniref:RING-type domain-containing protein n=1 Tax=Astyanax mexicanus TaxID=7994 RepID=A0A3B1K1D4_ASTMX